MEKFSVKQINELFVVLEYIEVVVNFKKAEKAQLAFTHMYKNNE